MAYKNPIYDYADRHPFLAFFIIPIGMNLVGRAVAMSIRSAKVGNPLGAIMPKGNDENVNLGAVINQGGDELDFLFRPTARRGPNELDSSEREFIQPQPESRPVRYDNEYRDDIFLNDPRYKPRSVPTSSPSVFAGLSGFHKLKR